MIDPKLLTDENGFEDGVVVEAVWSDVPGDNGVYYFNELTSMEWADSVSLKVLTGPMAIWNFAPEWASLLIQNSNGWFWMNHRPDELAQSDVVTYRPFWAKAQPMTYRIFCRLSLALDWLLEKLRIRVGM